MTGFDTVATVTAAVCSGVAGGVYFAFSALVLPGLRSRPVGEAVTAMRAVNVAAVRPAFMVVFFGGAVSAAAVVVFDLLGEPRPMRIAGGVLALAAVGITVLRNVPLNEALARGAAGGGSRGSGAAGGGQGGEVIWSRFEPGWRRANHARAIASGLATLALTASLTEV